MTTIESTSRVIGQAEALFALDEDQLAVVAFLARYRGRILEADRHDLRALFQWAADHHLAVLETTRVFRHRRRPTDHGLRGGQSA
jgi:hypothetical protein